MNKKRLAALAADADFLALISDMEIRATKKVMALATSDEDRTNALAEYHALQRIKAQLQSVAHDVRLEND